MQRRPRTGFEQRFERLLQDEITRRHVLRRGAAGAFSMSALAYLAACGGDELSGGGKASTKAIPAGKVAGTMNFSNWPLYIDIDDKTKGHPSLDLFQKKYGTKVKYTEEVNDNTEFFGKVRQEYAEGSSGGRDIHVVTDWMAARMKRLGYVQRFDKSVDAQRGGEHRGRGGQPGLRSEARVLDAVAVGPHRAHLPEGPRRRDRSRRSAISSTRA